MKQLFIDGDQANKKYLISTCISLLNHIERGQQGRLIIAMNDSSSNKKKREAIKPFLGKGVSFVVTPVIKDAADEQLLRMLKQHILATGKKYENTKAFIVSNDKRLCELFFQTCEELKVIPDRLTIDEPHSVFSTFSRTTASSLVNT